MPPASPPGRCPGAAAPPAAAAAAAASPSRSCTSDRSSPTAATLVSAAQPLPPKLLACPNWRRVQTDKGFSLNYASRGMSAVGAAGAALCMVGHRHHDEQTCAETALNIDLDHNQPSADTPAGPRSRRRPPTRPRQLPAASSHELGRGDDRRIQRQAQAVRPRAERRRRGRREEGEEEAEAQPGEAQAEAARPWPPEGGQRDRQHPARRPAGAFGLGSELLLRRRAPASRWAASRRRALRCPPSAPSRPPTRASLLLLLLLRPRSSCTRRSRGSRRWSGRSIS